MSFGGFLPGYAPGDISYEDLQEAHTNLQFQYAKMRDEKDDLLQDMQEMKEKYKKEYEDLEDEATDYIEKLKEKHKKEKDDLREEASLYIRYLKEDHEMEKSVLEQEASAKIDHLVEARQQFEENCDDERKNLIAEVEYLKSLPSLESAMLYCNELKAELHQAKEVNGCLQKQVDELTLRLPAGGLRRKSGDLLIELRSARRQNRRDKRVSDQRQREALAKFEAETRAGIEATLVAAAKHQLDMDKAALEQQFQEGKALLEGEYEQKYQAEIMRMQDQLANEVYAKCYQPPSDFETGGEMPKLADKTFSISSEMDEAYMEHERVRVRAERVFQNSQIEEHLDRFYTAQYERMAKDQTEANRAAVQRAEKELAERIEMAGSTTPTSTPPTTPDTTTPTTTTPATTPPTTPTPTTTTKPKSTKPATMKPVSTKGALSNMRKKLGVSKVKKFAPLI